MFLGIGVAILVLVFVTYVAWLANQCLNPGARSRKIEKRTARRSRREDRKDLFRKPKQVQRPVDDVPDLKPSPATKTRDELQDSRQKRDVGPGAVSPQ